jgi:hypothetical protein
LQTIDECYFFESAISNAMWNRFLPHTLCP